MKLLRNFVLILSVFAALVFYQCRSWVLNPGELDETVNVFIPKGAGVAQAASLLAEKNIISSSLLFRLTARFSGLDKELKAGEYQFEPGVSLWKAMEKIANGEVFYRKITLPEGLTTGQYLYLIASNPELTGEITEDVKEGELLPETYSFEYGSERNALIKQAKNAMKKAKEEIWNDRDKAIEIHTPDEMIVLASIIEKETGRAEERKLVSSVFMNRLRKGMRLQTDPTVIYALTEGEFELKRPLTKADLAIESPYNTYRNIGLPPGPICNPGRAAIMAAVHPAQSRFLYFVADGSGGHSFASNLQQHNDNVAAWKKNQK